MWHSGDNLAFWFSLSRPFFVAHAVALWSLNLISVAIACGGAGEFKLFQKTKRGSDEILGKNRNWKTIFELEGNLFWSQPEEISVFLEVKLKNFELSDSIDPHDVFLGTNGYFENLFFSGNFDIFIRKNRKKLL